MTVLGSIAHDQHMWASVLVGTPGFMQAEDERTVIFDLTAMTNNPHDPF